MLEDDAGDARLLRGTLDKAGPGQFCLTVAGRLKDALTLLHDRTFHVILTDLNVADSQGIGTFLQIRAQAASIPVLVWSGLADEAMAIEAVRLGAQDYLIKGESNGTQVLRALRYAFERDKLQRSQVVTALRSKGKSIALIGVKGGVGTTTVAANVAVALACKPLRVTLVELNPFFGTLSAQLCRNQPATNLQHVLDRGVETFTERDLVAPLASTVPQLRVLFSPQTVNKEFALIEPDQAISLLHKLVEVADYTIVDLPSQPSPCSIAVMQNCDYVAFVVERDVACVAAAKVFLESLNAWNISELRVGAVVVNRGGSSLPVEMHQLQSELKCRIVGVIHHTGDALVIAQKAGTPLVIAQPDHLASEMFFEIAERLQTEPVSTINF